MLALLYLILSQPLVILDSLLGPAGRWWEETAAPAARQLDDDLVLSSADRISSDQCYSEALSLGCVSRGPLASQARWFRDPLACQARWL